MSGRIVKSIISALDRAGSLVQQPDRERPAHLRTGERGEEAAYFYLRKMGYVIVARNWRSPLRRGELDLVAWEGGTLCFIEVKTRTTRAVKPAEAAVDFEKQRDLRAVAEQYLRRIDATPPARFDIVSVYFEEGREPELTVFKNAFAV